MKKKLKMNNVVPSSQQATSQDAEMEIIFDFGLPIASEFSPDNMCKKDLSPLSYKGA